MKDRLPQTDASESLDEVPVDDGFEAATLRWVDAFTRHVEQLREGQCDSNVEEELATARLDAISFPKPAALIPWIKSRNQLLDALIDEGLAGDTMSLEVTNAVVEEARWLRFLMARSGLGRIDAALTDVSRAAMSAADLDSDDAGDAKAAIQADLHRVQVTIQEIRLLQLESAGQERHGPALLDLLAGTENVVDHSAGLVNSDGVSSTAVSLKQRAEALLAKLEQQVDDEIRHEEPERAVEMARLMANYGLERLDEALLIAADVPPASALAFLERAHERSKLILAEWRSLSRSRRQAPKEVKKLRSAQRRLANETQELGLQARLERIFGWSFVSMFERLILTLILVVVGLLLIEAAADLTDDTRIVFMWIDTGICAVFLLEFFTKLVLVPGRRLRWFWRHFLIDFLPSIPFGFFALSLSKLDVIRVGRAGRLIRLSRLTRYIRILRPFVRLFRVLAFILRGLDRIVRRHMHLLNRDVLLFTPQAALSAPSSQLLAESLATSQQKAQRLLVRKLDHLRSEQIPTAVHRGIRSTAEFLDRISSSPVSQVFEPPRPPSRAREIRIEELLEWLQSADEATIRRRLGVDLTRRLARKIRRFDIPMLRAMPLVRHFAPGARRLPDGGLLARASHALGSVVRRLYDRMLTVGDLTGVVSGPQLLDRVGSTLARATGVPARRLLILGGAFLLISGLVRLTGFETLGDVMKLLSRYMGTPLLVLGGVALGLYLIGMWLQRIAGEATNVLERTAEAQYLNLLKLAKNAELDDSLAFLYRRTLEPEHIADSDNRAEFSSPNVSELRNSLTNWSPDFDPTEDLATRHQRRVMGLFRDYLDGAILHRSDHKTTEQLLGNLAIRNLCERRLSFGRAQRKAIRRLDMSAQGGFKGTFFWFHSITRTIAQRTAELLLEYNRHAIPLTAQARLSTDEQDTFHTWIENRKAGKPFRAFHAELPYSSTTFTALHFLSPNPDIEAAVAAEFGQDVLTALKRDRRKMIREVFGTYPLHRLPRDRRLVNPYVLYRRYVAGFRIILLPFVLARSHLRALWFLLRRFWQIVTEVRRPELVKQNLRQSIAGFGVAIRKIGRMRHEAFTESSWIRALADVEYLGLGFALSDQFLDCGTFDDDLDAIGSSVFGQRQRYVQLRYERRRDLKLLQTALRNRGVSAGDVGPLMTGPQDRIDDETSQRILRAVTVAFATNDSQCRSLLTAIPRLEATFESVLADRDQLPHRSLALRFVDSIRRVVGQVIPIADPLPGALARYLANRGEPVDQQGRRALLRAARSNFNDIASLLRLAGSEEFLGRTDEVGFERLRDLSAETDRIEEELITIRTVQSLTLLDIKYYRNLICELGEYSAEEGAVKTVIEDGKMISSSTAIK